MNDRVINIGVSGDEGSFSEQAALHYAALSHLNVSLRFLIDMENVLAALHETDLGIFPVFNNRGGIVVQAFEAMGKNPFTYLSSFNLEIHQCLITQKHINLDEITQVVSHPQALAQCEGFIKKYMPNAKISAAQDTAQSARELANGAYENTTAVIAPEGCVKHYGLHLAKKSIQDINPNITTFIVVKERAHENH